MVELGDADKVTVEIQMGAGQSTLALGDLTLTRLNIEGGAGEAAIDLTGDRQHELEARIVGGLGDINFRLPSDVGTSIEVESGVGSVHANGLTRDGNTYHNDAYQTSGVVLRIEIDSGGGQINIDVQ